MGNILITENTSLCDDGYECTFKWFTLIIILMSVSVIIAISIYGISRKQLLRKINRRDSKVLSVYKNKIVNSLNAIPIQRVKIRYRIPKTCTVCISSIDLCIESTVKLDKPINQMVPLTEDGKLICFCDGSYSHRMQIGYSGFQASNGARRTRFFSSSEPRNGSTATEVLAACLAIEYALEQHYNTLLIYTDNSKVEQLLKRPKRKDIINYPDICQSLDQYRKEKGTDTIQVIRVRGHPSISEQRKCQIKYQFAKIDQAVRKKTHRYIKRWWKRYEQNSYSCYIPVYYSYFPYQVLAYYT